MATATSAKSTTSTELPEIAAQVREQLVSTVKQGQKLTVDAVQAWSKAASALPVPELPQIPGVASLPGVEAITAYTFDLAIELLNAQREFAIQLAVALTPTKAA
ncbi:MAG TPA: hypothetical protein VK662_14610 [Acidothermaceae bacterium]|jgi:hypothetical protein|nr:hypothetical protein [Acidothermaceae bacterium]